MPYTACVVKGSRNALAKVLMMKRQYFCAETLCGDLAAFLFENGFLFQEELREQARGQKVYWIYPQHWRESAQGRGACAVKMPDSHADIKDALLVNVLNQETLRWLCQMYGSPNFEKDRAFAWRYDIFKVEESHNLF